MVWLRTMTIEAAVGCAGMTAAYAVLDAVGNVSLQPLQLAGAVMAAVAGVAVIERKRVAIAIMLFMAAVIWFPIDLRIGAKLGMLDVVRDAWLCAITARGAFVADKAAKSDGGRS